MRRILQLDLSLAPSKWYSIYPFKIPAILKLTHMVIVHPFHQGLSGCTLCNCSFFPDSRLDFCSYQSNLFTGFKTTGPSKFNISGFGFQYLYVKLSSVNLLLGNIFIFITLTFRILLFLSKIRQCIADLLLTSRLDLDMEWG